MELRLLVGTIDATGRGVAGGPGVALGPRMAVRQEPASQALVALTREAAVCRVLRGLVASCRWADRPGR